MKINTSGESVARLVKRLSCKLHRTASHLDLIGRRREVETCAADFVIDLAAQVLELLPALPQGSFCLQYVCMGFSAGKDGNVQRRRHFKYAVGISRTNSRRAVDAGMSSARTTFGDPRA